MIGHIKTSAAVEEEIFLEGLAVPLANRSEFVSSRCGDNQELVDRVNALLRGYEDNSAFLEKPPASGSVGSPAASAGSLRDHAPGDRVGPYRLVERIGEGGCGVVYRAEQEQPVRRQVALKVIKLGMDTHEFVARFEAERQALAMMDHANIARVFDAGATDTGRPFFVMELVRGIPITRYCDEHRLTLIERLKLFEVVCQAIQHAHQKGVVHRDLKPSNILVGNEGAHPVPKVIDFGIAKAMDVPLTDSTFATLSQAFVGTPAYTSPEQVAAGSGDVDTRSDVFSLGVVLYELIAGKAPFDRDVWEKAGLEETRRLIREVDPPRPSARVTALAVDQRAAIAVLRCETPARLSSLLSADLDWVIMKSIEKERTRRYETVSALAMDVRRFLEHQPVLARPPSRRYRVAKFVRRHRVGVLASALITASLIVGFVATGVSLSRVRAARDRAESAERSEFKLRQRAELARKDEARRATRAIIDLATERLSQGRATDALNHLVTAVRRDPTNPHVAPLLASVLTSRHFALPTAPLASHAAAALGLEFSMDGSHLVALWEDGTIGWIDVRSGAIEKSNVPGPRMGFTRMPTRRHLLLYSPNGVIRSVDRETGRIVHEIKFEYDAMGCRAIDDTTELFSTKLTSNHMMVADAATGKTIGDPVPYEGYFGSGGKWMAWSADGTKEPTRHIRFRRTDGDHREMTLEFPFPFVPGKLATNADGTRMATVQREGSEHFLRIWSLPEAVSLAKSPPLERDAYTFYSPDDRFVFCWGRGLEMFDAETARPLARMPSTGVFIDETRYAFSSDGRILATWGPADRVELWDLEAGARSVATLHHGETVDRVSFSADAKVLMTTGENDVRIWDTTTGELIAEPVVRLGGVSAVALMPSGDEVAIGTSDGEIFRFSAKKRGVHPLEVQREGTLPVAFLPGSPTRVLRMTAKEARVLDLATGREAAPRVQYPEPIRTAGVREDGKVIVAQTVSGVWQVWWMDEGRINKVLELPDRSTEMTAIVFSKARDLVALSRADHLQIFRLEEGKPVRPPLKTAINYSFARFADFSPDAKRIVLGSNQGRARIWNVDTGEEEIDFGQQPTRILIASFSPDGRKVVGATRFGGVQLWDATTGKALGREVRHRGYYAQGIFSPDGQVLAGFANERTLHFRDVATDGTILRSVEADGALRTGAFSRDGRRYVTGTIDGTAQVWDVGTGLPVTESLNHGAMRVVETELSDDGKFVRTHTAPDHVSRFWPVPSALVDGQETPAWLVELAAQCAGKTENRADGTSAERVSTADALRQTILSQPADAPFAEWGRWFIADEDARSIAPGFSITPEQAQRLREAQ